MGAIPPIQHMHTLPHLARELLGNWLLLFLSKMLDVGTVFTKGRNGKKCSFLVSFLLQGGIWILGNGIQQAVTDVQSGVWALVQTHVVNSAAPDIGSCSASLAFSPPPLFLSSISSLCFLHLRRYAVDKYISLPLRTE